MSTPAGGSGLRTGGLVLLGLAVVLLIGGLFSLRADDGPSSAQGARPSTTVPTTRAATTTAPATTQPTTQPTTTALMTTTPAPAPPTPAPPPTTVAPVTDPRTSTGVVVLNNSTVTGLASRAADAVRADGWTVREVGNLAGRSPSTTVYYPEGRAAAARALAATVGAGSVQPRPDGLPGPGEALVLVVTSDFGG